MANKSRYPTGVRPLLVEETARRRRIEGRVVEVLERARFAEVVLPIIDYAEPYTALQSNKSSRESYRFVDREGELVAIRSDFTPMVARALAPAITAADLPLRIFYRGDVVRCDGTKLGANRELFQIGAEIIGDPSINADIEILRVASNIVRAFGLTPFGYVSLTEDSEELASAFPEFEMRRDEDDDRGYYTGMRFYIYNAASRTRLAQGGRYDNLYASFGAPAAAAGFTFTIDDLD